MSESIRTIAQPSEGIFKLKGSKFLAFAFPVNDSDQVNELIKAYKQRFHDARHVCFAYVLGEDNATFRVNDDGEPPGTAGKPILGQINASQLSNILVIVVRYFGGVLLGTGGLVVAYREATAEALKNAEITEKNVFVTLNIEFEYERINEVIRILKKFNGRMISYISENQSKMQLEIPRTAVENVRSELLKINRLTFL